MDDMIFNIVKENNVIGKGTFGKIYYYPKSYPNYVVKRMRKYNNYGNNFILNNMKELWWYFMISKHDLNLNDNSIDINNMFNINFNNIPKLLDYNVNSDNISLLIDYKGNSLYSMIKDCKEIYKNNNNINELSIKTYLETLKLIPQIIYSCSKVFMQLHYANIRHGDITISNIMFNKNEPDIYKKISIIDWGSFVFSKLIINNYNQCAPDFMAPELNNDIIADTDTDTIPEIPSIKSDIFSLGIVLLNILDPSKQFMSKIDKYIKDSIMIYNQYETLDDIIDEIIDKYKHIDIEKYIDKRVFYLLRKMLDTNTTTRLDIDSLYMDELFTKYRNDEKQFDKYYLKNILRKRLPIFMDDNKNIIIDHTYNYLKSFKARIINNVRNSKYYKLIDTRVILMPSIQLFYTYLNKMNENIDNVQISCLDNLFCKGKNEESLETIDNKHKFQSKDCKNINHYIISFLCCIKWIDILFNDDVSIYYLYEFYKHLYNCFSKTFPESILLDLLNFGTFFDLTFFNIFKKIDGNILTYPYFMDFKYDYLNYSEVKKILMSSEKV